MAFPPMNSSIYFSEYYIQRHVDLFVQITSYLSPLALVINVYGLYAITFNSGKHLKFLKPHLFFHQITLILMDFVIFDIGRPVLLLPIAAGFSTTFLKNYHPYWAMAMLSACIACWAMTCTSAIQVLLFKHQNLWPPGSRWTMSPRNRFLLCAYVNVVSASAMSIPLYVNGVHYVATKHKLMENGLAFLSPLFDQPHVLALDQEAPSFIFFIIAIIHLFILFTLTLVVGAISTYQGLTILKRTLSQKTFLMQKKYLFILITQMTAPLLMSFIPGVSAIVVIVTRFWVPVGYSVMMFSMAGTHGSISTLCTIFLNECYRKPFLKIVLFPLRILKPTKIQQQKDRMFTIQVLDII